MTVISKRKYSNLRELKRQLQSIPKGKTLAVWYDGGSFYFGNDSPDQSHWIGDFDMADTVDFVVEITDRIMSDIENSKY